MVSDNSRIDGFPFKISASIIAVLISVTVIAYSAFLSGEFPRRRHAMIVLGGSLLVFYLTKLEGQEDSGRSKLKLLYFVTLSILSFIAISYAFASYSRWLSEGRMFLYTNLDLVVGAILIFLVIEGTTREYGYVLGSVGIITLIYALFGNYFPGLFRHAGIPLDRLIAQSTITLTGVFGFLTQIGATWIAIFIIFAALVEGFGGFKVIVALSNRMIQRSKYILPQAAVLSSMLIGMMMGSSAANVATTGSFTIPLLKENDIPPSFAAGIESIASTGGQLMPPIMGTAAFLMADLLGIRYSTVIVGATIPAIFFYFVAGISILLASVKFGWFETTDSVDSSLESVDVFEEYEGNIGIDSLQFLLPLLFLIYLLVFARFGPMSAGFYTIVFLIGTSFIKYVYRGKLKEFIFDTYEGLRLGGTNLAPLMVAIAMLGMVVQIIAFTGLTQAISFQIIQLGGEVLILVLLLVMITSILFGMGLPTPAAYILVAIVAGQALIEVGIPPLAGHLFIFYFALLSAITPPIAVAVIIAANIADVDFLRAVKATFLLGWATFVVPFIFIANPEVIYWSYPTTPITVIQILIALLAIVIATVGHNWFRDITYIERAILFAIFLGIVFIPISWMQSVSAIICIMVLLGSAYVDKLPMRNIVSVR